MSTRRLRSATQTQRLASVGTLVRVLAPPVKAGISQGEASAACHGFIACHLRRSNSVPHRVSTLYVQASPGHVSDSIASVRIGRKVTRRGQKARARATIIVLP